MLTIQKNDLFNAVNEAELEPELFKIEEDSTSRGTVFVLIAAPMRFEVRHSEGSFDQVTYRYSVFAPGFPYAKPDRPKNYASQSEGRRKFIDSEIAGGWHPVTIWCAFQQAATAFRNWLKLHVKPALTEAAARDLWADAASAVPNFDHLPPGEAEPFGTTEQTQVREAIAHFSGLIEETFAPDVEQMREISARLNYLADAVQRLNKFDWKALAVSTVIGVGTTLSLDTQAGRQMWALFRQAMQAIGRLLGS